MPSLSPASARKAGSPATTWAPSPTAAATRLTDPERTSPIAKTPGRLVSSGRPPPPRLASVSTKPLSSSATPYCNNHSVFGSAPMNRKRWRIGCRTSRPDGRQRPRIHWRGPIVDARAFECREILDIKASVSGAAGDNHRAGADAFTIGETQKESPATRNRLILQTYDFVRYRHLGPELLRLVVGARHQSHASDVGRKTQIILDPGGGARLATEGSAIQNEHRETLGRRVDRRGETRGSGADDSCVIDFGGIDGPEET